MNDKKLEILLAAKDITSQAFDRVDGKLKAITKSVFSLQGAFAAAASLAGIGYFIKQSLGVADQLGKTADKLGLSTSALQEYRYAASQTGVEQHTLDMAMQRFSRRVGEAAQGTGELKDTLKMYNIEVRDSEGRARALENVFADLADVIRGAESDQERLRIAFKAFDSEGAALVNLLRDGSAGVNQFRKDARDLGIVMDEQLIRNSEKANDELDKLSRIIKVQVTSAVAGLAPEIVKFTDEMIDSSKEIKNYARDIASIGMAAIMSAGKVANFFDIVGRGLGIAAGSAIYGPDTPLGKIDQQIEAAEWRVLRFQRTLDRGLGGEGLKTTLKKAQDQLAALQRTRMDILWDMGAGNRQPAETQTPAKPGSVGAIPAEKIADMSYDLGLVNYELGIFAKQSEAGWAAYQEGLDKVDHDKFLSGIAAADIAVNQMTMDVEAGVAESLKSMEDAADDTFDGLVTLSERTADAMEQNFSDFFFNMMTGKFSDLKDVGLGVLESLQRATADYLGQLVKMGLFETDWVKVGLSVAGKVAGAFSGGGGAGDAASFYPDNTFARGGVISAPTVFPMAGGMGLMGEAGPEAVMPLTRLPGGDLGVKTKGSGTPVINIFANDAQSFIEMAHRNPNAILVPVIEGLQQGGQLRDVVRSVI